MSICLLEIETIKENEDMTNLGCTCGHELDEHRQLDADRFCVGDNFRCTCKGYNGREEA